MPPLPTRTQPWRLGVAAATTQLALGGAAWIWCAATAAAGFRAGLIAMTTAAIAAIATLLLAWRRAARVAEAAGAAAELLEARGAGERLSRPGNPPGQRELPGELATLLSAATDAIDTMAPRLVELDHLVGEQRAIFASMGAGLLAIDPEQRILSVNRSAATMLGVEAERVRGRLVQEAARLPGLNRFIGDAIASEGATRGEFTLERDGRGRLIVQADSEPLRDAGGERSGLLISLSDITQLRRLESLRSDFAANVSHELRTPITNIKGYAETLLQVGVEDGQQTMRFLEIIQRNAQRLGAIIEDLLALARLEQTGARETLDSTESELRRIVENATADLTSAAHAKGISLAIEIPDELRACVTPSLVQQAIANLVSNAITYSPPQSIVRIVGRTRADDMVEIAVIDRGPGIAPHHLPRIFERFYRVDKARSREHGGTGLGLAIVKHIAQVQGGSVEVESRLSAGSTFRLILPATEAAMAQIAG